ncbi:hypothetical protein [Streptomyces sp. NPDC056144]|uniref:hypothetical protein n=1 Tax=unclassified Streptomyces TaxID=2593676 RepID=UPI0035DD2C2C
MTGPLLYLRSRGLPGTLAALLCTAAAAAWGTTWAGARPEFAEAVRLTAVFGPLLVSGAIGTGLYAPGAELDRTAVRAWWPYRAAHLLGPTALAAALFALVVPPGTEGFGAPAAVRNTLGLVGLAAASAVFLGARLSWLPPVLVIGAAHVAAPTGSIDGGTARWVWAWVARPGTEGGAWAAAIVCLAAGAGLYAWRGARRDGA